jgi:spermidine synthase
VFCVWGDCCHLFPLIALLKGKSYTALLILLPFFFAFTGNVKKRHKSIGDKQLVYDSEGVFGQIRVYDSPVQTYSRGQHIRRTLYVNNVGQSNAFRDNLYFDTWDYSYLFPTAVSMFPRGSKALLMGLGGGTIVHQYNRLGFDLEVVEIDERIKETAINYFAVSPNTTILIDDARHYINICKKKYDVITFDMFLNETPPAQVLSLETFIKVKELLNPDGLWVLNYFGYTSGSKGRSARSILKTLKKAGFYVEILATPSYDEASRNIIFLSSHKKFDFSGINYEEPGLPKIENITKFFLDLSKIDLQDAELLTDKKPRFDNLYLEPSLDWRKRTIDHVVKPIASNKNNLLK